MKPATLPSVPNDAMQYPLALIESQDTPFTQPLRQYLETHGCMVSVNTRNAQGISYHIIVGTVQFVKDIYVQGLKGDTKQLIIFLDGESSNTDAFLNTKTKIIFIDPKPLSEIDVVEIFSFFFTSQDRVRDYRKEKGFFKRSEQAQSIPKEEPEVHKSKYGDADVLNRADHERIGNIIAEVFDQAKSSQAHPKLTGTNHRWAILVTVFLFLFFTTPVLYVFAFGMSAYSAAKAGSSIAIGDTNTSQAYVRSARSWHSFATSMSPYAITPIGLLMDNGLVHTNERYMSVLDRWIQTEEGVLRIFTLGEDLGTSIIGQSVDKGDVSQTSAILLLRMRDELALVMTSLRLSQAQTRALLSDRPFPLNQPALETRILRMVDTLARVQEDLVIMDRLLTLYPHIGGFSGKMTYLVLLQNSMELRPTGGFIGSVAVVSLANGKLVDLDVRDVYELDGQLRGHVAPPKPIKEILGQEHWYLRDSNWDPNFRVSAAQAAWFFHKESGLQVDGVIGVSSPFLVDLLKATGPLDVADYNDRITADNFFGKSLFYTQSNFFPGSTQKKDFLGALTGTLLARVTSRQRISPQKLFQALSTALAQHDIQFYFGDSERQRVIDQFGWSGIVPRVQTCHDNLSQCFFDRISLVEANLGVNKANYFLNRVKTHDIRFLPSGSVAETVSIIFENTSPRESQKPGGGGEYKGYLQVLLPITVADIRITFDGQPVPERSRSHPDVMLPMPYREIISSVQHSQAIGVAFDVPIGGTRVLEIQYRHTSDIPFVNGRASYELFFDRQPGLLNTTTRVRIHYPIYWSVTQGSGVDPGFGKTLQGISTLVAKEAVLEYNTQLPSDSWIRLGLYK